MLHVDGYFLVVVISRCVIVMTNLAFALVGRKRVGTVEEDFDM